jgi:hypothetical protein
MLLSDSATAQTALQPQQPSGLDPSLKDVAQVGWWIAAIVFGFVALIRTLREVRENRQLRSEELRWKKASLARDTLVALKTNAKVIDALTMLDWTGREYEVGKGLRDTVTWGEIERALRPHDSTSDFADKEVYVRDCFDNLLDGIEEIEHLQIGLIEFEDVRYPLAYYIKKLNEHQSAVSRYIEFYDYKRAAALIARF